jgi:SprT protein
LFQIVVSAATSKTKKMQLSLLEPLFAATKTPRTPGHQLIHDSLRLHIPEEAVEPICQWFTEHPVRLRIAPPRSSKFGDYRPPRSGVKAIISVNQNLNPYDFLITLVHEMAHDVILGQGTSARPLLFRKRKPRPKPHGTEWKHAYHELLLPMMTTRVFPSDILLALETYFRDTSLSARASHLLAVTLKKYDTPDGREFLKDLPDGEIFFLPGGKAFRKREQLRKRFRCESLNNRRVYLFSPLARVSRNNL